MRQPDDAAAVRRDLHRHAFAHAAEAVAADCGTSSLKFQVTTPFAPALALLRTAGLLTLDDFADFFLATTFLTAFFLAAFFGVAFFFARLHNNDSMQGTNGG